ncbi:MAG: hypothetical protein AAGF29_03910 [Pseudomonadota bacterium]
MRAIFTLGLLIAIGNLLLIALTCQGAGFAVESYWAILAFVILTVVSTSSIAILLYTAKELSCRDSFQNATSRIPFWNNSFGHFALGMIIVSFPTAIISTALFVIGLFSMQTFGPCQTSA